MEWVLLGIVGIVALGLALRFVLSQLVKQEAKTNEPPVAHPTWTAPSSPVPPAPRRGQAQFSVADMLARVQSLQARNGQWSEIWDELNPNVDPTMKQMLMDLRNSGLQFAPSDGLRKIELACEELAAAPNSDATVVLKKVLGKTDILDTFK